VVAKKVKLIVFVWEKGNFVGEKASAVPWVGLGLDRRNAGNGKASGGGEKRGMADSSGSPAEQRVLTGVVGGGEKGEGPRSLEVFIGL